MCPRRGGRAAAFAAAAAATAAAAAAAGAAATRGEFLLGQLQANPREILSSLGKTSLLQPGTVSLAFSASAQKQWRRDETDATPKVPHCRKTVSELLPSLEIQFIFPLLSQALNSQHLINPRLQLERQRGGEEKPSRLQPSLPLFFLLFRSFSTSFFAACQVCQVA